jgi:hypothetical protein
VRRIDGQDVDLSGSPFVLCAPRELLFKNEFLKKTASTVETIEERFETISGTKEPIDKRRDGGT